jgi:hypothetical protein
MNQLEIVIKAKDEFSQYFATLNKTVDAAKKNLASVSGEASSVTASFGQMSTAVVAAGGALTAAGVAAGGFAAYLLQSSKASQGFAGHLSDLAAKAGKSTTFMQEIDAAGKLVGASLETTTSSLAKFNARLGDGDSKTFVEGLGKINVSVAQLRAMSPDDQFNKIAAAIRDVGSVAEQADITKKLFGSLSILPLITSDFEAAAAQAHKLGNVMSVEMVAAGDLLGDRVDVLSGTWANLNLQVGGLINQNASVHAFVTGLTDMLGELKTKVFENTTEFQRFVSGGVGFAVDGLSIFVKAARFAWSTFDSLIIITKAAEIAFIGLGRAFLELDRMRSFLVIGGAELRKNLDAQIAGADALQKTLREEQAEIKRTREERGKAVEAIAAQLELLKGKISSVAGQSVLIGESMKHAGQIGGDALAAGFGKAEKAAEKALQKFKDSWSYANLPKPGEFMGPPNPYSSTWDGEARPGGVELPSDEFSTSHNNLGVIGHGVMTNAQIVSMYEAAKAAGLATKGTADFSKSLQSIANVATTSSSTLAKAVASVAGGGAGIADGLGSLFGTGGQKKTDFGSGLTGFLGKAGAWGQVASSAISIGSSLFGLFSHSKEKAELADLRKQLEGMSETAKRLGFDISSAFASKNPAQLKETIDSITRGVEEQRKRLEGLSTAAGGLNTFTAGGVGDQGSFDRSSRYATAIFGGQVKETGDVAGALKSISAALADMGAKAKEFGFSVGAGFANLIGMSEVLKDENLSGQLSGLNQMAKGFNDANMLTKDLMGDLGADAAATYATIIDGGHTSTQAMSLMQPTLQILYEAQKKHGYAVDETTQGILDQAKAEGIVGDAFMSANERIVELLGILVTLAGGTLPAAFGRAADAAEDSASRMAGALAGVRVPTGGGFNPNPGDIDGPGFASGTAFRNFGAGTRVTLHGEEAVLTRPQVDRLVSMAVAGAPGSTVPQQSQPIVIHVSTQIDGREIASSIARVIQSEVGEAHQIRAALRGRSGHF